MSHRAAVHQLESDFADAMTRMYAVGNGLARLRSEIDREDAARGARRPPPPPGRRAGAASRPLRRERRPPRGHASAAPTGVAPPASAVGAPPPGRGAPAPVPGTAARAR